MQARRERARLCAAPDPNLRVLSVRALEGAPPDEPGAGGGPGARARGAVEVVSGQAPVLLIPGVLDLETCARPDPRAETRGASKPASSGPTRGAPRTGLIRKMKRRRTTRLRIRAAGSLTAAVGRRVMPEVRGGLLRSGRRGSRGLRLPATMPPEGGISVAHRDNPEPGDGAPEIRADLELRTTGTRAGIRVSARGVPLLARSGRRGGVLSGSHLHECAPRDAREAVRAPLLPVRRRGSPPAAFRWCKNGAERGRGCRCSSSSVTSAGTRDTSRPRIGSRSGFGRDLMGISVN